MAVHNASVVRPSDDRARHDATAGCKRGTRCQMKNASSRVARGQGVLFTLPDGPTDQPFLPADVPISAELAPQEANSQSNVDPPSTFDCENGVSRRVVVGDDTEMPAGAVETEIESFVVSVGPHRGNVARPVDRRRRARMHGPSRRLEVFLQCRHHFAFVRFGRQHEDEAGPHADDVAVDPLITAAVIRLLVDLLQFGQGEQRHAAGHRHVVDFIGRDVDGGSSCDRGELAPGSSSRSNDASSLLAPSRHAAVIAIIPTIQRPDRRRVTTVHDE